MTWLARLKRALVVFVAAAAAACASAGDTPRPRPFPGAPIPPSTAPSGTARTETHQTDGIVATALALQGVPYRNGGSDPTGFDCSGLVQWVFAQHGIRMPREAHQQFSVGTSVNRGEVRPGDLLFFETVSDGASHVGLAIGGDRFVHAPNSRGVVRVERFTANYWAAHFVGARRLD